MDLFLGGEASLRVTEEGRLKADCKELFEANGFYYRSVIIVGIPGRTSPSKGLPDAIVCRGGVTAWIEFKTPKGTISEEQMTFIQQWTAHGGLVFVVRTFKECQDVVRKLKLIPQSRREAPGNP